MNQKLIYWLFRSFSYALCMISPAFAEQDFKSIQGRFEVVNKDPCLVVTVYITNTTSKEITIITGIGGDIRGEIPYFTCTAPFIITPTKWKSVGTNHTWRPDKLVLPPGKEIKYDFYVIQIPPPGSDINEGQISFMDPSNRERRYFAKLFASKRPVGPAENKEGSSKTNK